METSVSHSDLWQKLRALSGFVDRERQQSFAHELLCPVRSEWHLECDWAGGQTYFF